MKRRLSIFFMVAGLAASVRGQTSPPSVPRTRKRSTPHELSRLKQISLMEAELAGARGTPAENLWKAQLLEAQYDDLTRDAGAARGHPGLSGGAGRYVKAAKPAEVVDGGWGGSRAVHPDAPVAAGVDADGISRHDAAGPRGARSAGGGRGALVHLAGQSLDAAMKQIEGAKPFDEPAYRRAYAASLETRYYSAWSLYYQAMARDPAAPDRAKLLRQATDMLGEWAVDEPDNGVNFQSYLLRGKALSEAGDPDKAPADLAKAQNDKAPNWVQYQARLQTVVVQLKAGDLSKAKASLEAFKRWIPKDNKEALLSVDLLGYRVAWAAALAKPDATEPPPGPARRPGRPGRHPPGRSAIPRSGVRATGAGGSRKQRREGAVSVAATRPGGAGPARTRRATRRRAGGSLGRRCWPRPPRVTIHSPPMTTRRRRRFCWGPATALLGELPDAIRLEVEFATAAPQDPCARQMIDLCAADRRIAPGRGYADRTGDGDGGGRRGGGGGGG